MTFRLRVRRPRLWAPGHPSLYRLDVLSGRAIAWTGMVGIRRLEVRDGLLFLNGRRFFARGAALHDHAPGVGAALRPANLRANLAILRDPKRILAVMKDGEFAKAPEFSAQRLWERAA